MSTEWSLLVAGPLTPHEMLDRLKPALAAGSVDSELEGDVLWVDLESSLGFNLAIFRRTVSHVEAWSDDGRWAWDPGPCVETTFALGKFSVDPAMPNILRIVAQVLTSGPEDVALLFNGERLFLTRTAGSVAKHQRDRLWNEMPEAEEIIPG